MARFETIDDDLLRRLPLPLAKLYRRAHNAKTPFDRHQTAYFLWEASLKLLGSAAIAAYAEHPQHDPQIAETLKKLARPSLGHWWEFVRIVVPVLAEAGDEGFQAVRATVLDRSRQDLPMVAALDFELCEALGIGAGTKNNVRVSELFDRLVHYRNREVGHGAAGQRAADFYGRMGRVLLSGTAELLARLDVLAGRRLIYIDEVRLQKTGHYLIERYALAGEAARRVESLERPAAEASRLPRPEQLYLEMAPPDAAEANPRLALTSLRPLLVYEATVDEILFLNARKNRQKCEYLCYTTGDHAERAELEGEQRALLARILGGAVEGVTFANWQAESQAGDEPAEAVPEGLARPLRRIGEFELLSELGHGNMGKVYRAWQPSLGRQVALKCISKADDAKARARFYREIHALGRVDHPHLVKIYTSGFEEEPCFYTMELVEGATLAAVCDTLHSRSSTAAGLDLDTWQASLSTACEESRKAEKALSEPGTEEAPPTALAGARSSAPGSDQAPADRTYVRQIVDLMRQVSLAAHALHEAGVVHRDIKPGNIMITADGTQAVLMDLGLAQLADDVDGKLTRTRQFVGTLRYASPEQVLAVGGIDRRSDIYSLGVSLWELLTLRPMYGATDEMPTPELMRRITSGDGERVRKFHPGIAADLEAIVHKCLEKDPTRRYATAAELAEDLSRWQRGELVTAQPLTMRYVAGKFVRRHRWPIGAAAVALVLAGAGLTDEYLRINRANLNLSAAVQEARQEREKANRARHEAEADRNLAEAERNNALHASERAKQAQADAEAQRDEARTQHAEADRQKQRAEIQERLAKQGEEEASRNFYTAQMHLAERAWEDENIARVVDLLETLWHGQDETDPRGFEWYFLWGLCNNVPEIARGHSKQVSAIAVSPDGQGMFTAGMDGTLKAWNLGPLPGQWRLAERIVSQSHFNLAMLGVAYSPDGKFVAFSVNSGAVALLHSVAKDGPPRILNHSMGAARALGVAFAPDGKVLASSGEDGTVKLWNTQTGELIRTIDTRRFGIGARLVVQDSKIVIQAVIPGGSAARDGRLKERDRILGIATGAEGTLEPADGKSIGEMVALVRGKAGTEVELEVEPADGSERTHYKLKREPIGIENLAVRSVAFAADGKTLAVGSTDGTIRLCDPATGDELATLAEHSDFVNVVAFAPDSQTLASCSADGSAMIWDVATRHRKYTLLGHVGAVLSLAFSPDGKTLATGAQDRTAKVWDPATGRQKGFPLGHTGMVTALAFTRDSQKLISGSSDGTVRIWNLGLERVRRAQGQHNSAVTSLVFASDGAWFATSGGDREVKLWDPMSGREKASLRGHVGQVRGLAIAPNNKTIATGSADASVKLWGAEGGEARLTLEGHQSEVSAVAFSPDGSMLASGSFDRSLRLWNPETGKLVR
ncbi:MAG TPA: protein kinase, partial [Isosphaeraceae bacterium]|nr:protein kinase [Isosphaeraceae bacterium]